jgi:hypothetical protein
VAIAIARRTQMLEEIFHHQRLESESEIMAIDIDRVISLDALV